MGKKFRNHSAKSTSATCPNRQPCSLWVWVYQEETKKLIATANVSISGPMNRRGQIPADAHCLFNGLIPGTYEVTASAANVKGFETSVVVTPLPYHVTIGPGEIGMASIYVRLHKVAFKLIDSKGRDVPGAAYEMVTPGAVTFKSVLKPDGSRRVAGIPSGNCKVRFPDYDRDLVEFVSSTPGT